MTEEEANQKIKTFKIALIACLVVILGLGALLAVNAAHLHKLNEIKSGDYYTDAECAQKYSLAFIPTDQVNTQQPDPTIHDVSGQG